MFMSATTQTKEERIKEKHRGKRWLNASSRHFTKTDKHDSSDEKCEQRNS